MTQPTPPAGAHRGALAIALLAGFVHTAAFAPLNLWWLQPLALAALLLSCRGATGGGERRHAALCGLAFGFAWFASGVAWVYVSMHRYGGMPAPMAAAALMLFAVYLGAFAAASLAASARSLQRAFARPSTRTMLAAALCFAVCWGAGEMLRGWLFTGFPWLSSGYAHTDGPLAGLAPIVGVHGIGMLAALVAAGLAFGIETAWSRRSAKAAAAPA
ncbi:MAG TPA: apolipoprotein N-acyltransferase, partial [Burkholderiaceae bacterium]|nr:apolipoprotein N-acyltransferase [Burkholderiaceae bacterium]